MKKLKNIVSVIVLALVMLNIHQAKANNVDLLTNTNAVVLKDSPNYSENDKKPKITITVTFGKASKGCKGFGVCKLSVSIGLKGGHSFIATNEDGHFAFIIDEKGLKEINEYFGGEMIILEEDVKLPDDIAKKLDLNSDYILKEGVYKITTGKNRMIIF